jgi:hypothetical protein
LLESLRSERAVSFVLTLVRSMDRIDVCMDAAHVPRFTDSQLDRSTQDGNACSHGVPARRSCVLQARFCFAAARR